MAAKQLSANITAAVARLKGDSGFALISVT
jgi:hypothetical protein